MTVLAAIFLIAALVQLFYYLYFFRRIGETESTASIPSLQPVSVIICAKNEATNLRKNIPLVASQQYPEFEIILVNDNSIDETEAVLMELQKQFENIRIIHPKKDDCLKGKRNALSAGIAAAKYDLIALTDADCTPASELWLQKLTSPQGKASIFIGYSPYLKYNTYLNKFIRFETFQSALQYLGFAMAGIPYMGTGRNLSYSRNIFRKEYLSAPKDIVSGDDDLFVNRVASATNTSVVLNKHSFTYSEPKHTIKDWVKQKQRHLSTGKYYKWQHQLLLGLFHLSQVLVHGLFIILLIAGHQVPLILTFYGIRLTLQMIVYTGAMKTLDERDLIKYIPFLDIFYSIYLIIFAPSVIINKNSGW